MTPRAHLPDGWEVPQTFRDRLGVRVGAQRAMIADGHLLLVLHEPPESGETERKGRFFWRQPDGTWSSKGLSTGAQALRKHFDQYAAMLDALDEEEERASNSDHLFAIVRSLAPLHSAARNLHATLQEAREKLPAAGDIIDFRDRAYQIQRNAGLLHDLAKEALEFEVAQQSEKLARTSHKMALSAHRLNTLAAFFFPIVTLSTIFGMNFTIPYQQSGKSEPFYAVVAGASCSVPSSPCSSPGGHGYSVTVNEASGCEPLVWNPSANSCTAWPRVQGQVARSEGVRGRL